MKHAAVILLLLISVPLSAQENLSGFKTLDNKLDIDMKSIDLFKNSESDSIKTYNLKTSHLFDSNYLQKSYNYNLKGNFSYMLYSKNDIIKGIGGINEAGGMLIYHPNNKLALAIGVSGVKYSMNGRAYNDFLFIANLNYKLNNWLKFYLYGQYSLNTYANSMSSGYGLSPQNCYGAGLIIGIANKNRYSIDLNVGIENAYNPMSGKWELNYKCGPEITLKKRK